MSAVSAGGVITLTAQIKQNAVVGTIVPCNIKWSTTVAAQNEVIIPISEMWLLTDCYVTSKANGGEDQDAQLRFKKDSDRLMDTSEILVTVVTSSNARPNGLHGNLQYEGGTHMQVEATNNVQTDQANRNIRAYCPFEKMG